MRQHQQGAALVIVLALLSGSLMIGVAGMNSALIDERLAGNYRAAALAQMAAEWRASQLDASDIVNSLDSYSMDCESLVIDDSDVDWPPNSLEVGDNASARYLPCQNSNGDDALLVQGRVEQASAVSFIVLSFSEFPALEDWEDIDKFFENIDSFLDANDVIETCSSSSIESGGIYYCDGDFSDDVDDRFDDVTLIARGDIDAGLRVDRDDGISVNFLSLGKFELRGSGGDVVNGRVWSKESGNVRGGGNEDFNISYCSPSFRIRGGNNTGDVSCDWEAFVQDSDFEVGNGGGISWTQF